MATPWENSGVFHLMRRVMQQHNQLWRQRLPELTPVQFAVLLSVSHMSGADQQAICEAAAVEKATMADVMRRMERSGLLTRTPSSRDGRRYEIHLTDRGRRTFEAAVPVVRSVRDDCLSAVPGRDAASLRQILTTIVRADRFSKDTPTPHERNEQQ